MNHKVLFLTLLFAVFPWTSAAPHNFYPSDCCSGNDCAPISGDLVQENGVEFIVHVPAGWPGATKAVDVRVPYADVRWTAPDGRYHACPVTYADFVPKFRCFFAPPRGT